MEQVYCPTCGLEFAVELWPEEKNKLIGAGAPVREGKLPVSCGECRGKALKMCERKEKSGG